MADPFGELADGRAARVWTLRAGGTTARVTDLGATLVALDFGEGSVVLGHEDAGAYERDDAYHGALVGRVSGRIGGSSFVLDGTRYEVEANTPPDQLHGGPVGFSFRLWNEEQATDDTLVLSLVSEAGDQGFPGRAEARVRFALRDGALRIEYEARSDAPTPFGLTQHPYVNLGTEDVLAYEVSSNVDRFTPLTAAGIPTGEVRAVAGTPLDLATPRRVGDLVSGLGEPLDHGLVAPEGEGASFRVAYGDRAVVLTSDQPCLQLYAGHKLKPPFRPHQGLAVEPQGWPDSLNHEAFPDQVLRPGETYRRFIEIVKG